MYDPADVVLPATFDDPLTLAPPHIRAMIEQRGVQSRPFDCWAPSERQLRASLAAAYGMITMIDDAVGQIVATLERTGLAERTVVVFTSDHGDMFGEHGLLLKHCVHYAACTQVPFVLHVPGAATGRTQIPVSSLDLTPTVLALAGLEPYRGLHGVDISGLLTHTAPTAPARDALLVEEDEVFGLPGLPAPVRMRTLITDEARLTTYGGQPFGELFDHRNDPNELQNLYADPGSRARRAEMVELLLDTITDAQDTGLVPRFSA
jgi:arylsulfatase A-like enzyme